MSSPPLPAALILAAGKGSRFGSQKLLHRVYEQTLLSCVIHSLLPLTAHRTYVVTGADAAEIERQHPGVEHKFIHNPDWQDGIGSSIARGVEEIGKQFASNNQTEKPGAILITLGDLVNVTTADYRDLVNCWQQQPELITCSSYSDSCGVPAIFPSRYFAQLEQLQGDRGAKKIIDSAGNQKRCIPLPAAADDIDRPTDLKRIR